VSPHIPFSRFHAALQAGDLEFVRRYRASFTLGLPDDVRIAGLTASQDPGGLEAEALTCIQRFAAEAPAQRVEDYARLVSAVRRMSYDPESGTGELLALCALRGIE
jgi:hypothetical protein